jgi:hypothetical protein
VEKSGLPAAISTIVWLLVSCAITGTTAKAMTANRAVNKMRNLRMTFSLN